MTQYDIWLNAIPGVGSGVILRLWKALGERKDFAEAVYRMAPERRRDLTLYALQDVHGGTIAKDAGEALCIGLQDSPELCLERIQEAGIQCTCICDEDYPERLRHIPDPPFALYYYGHLPSDEQPSVGIVGTRMASPYGREQARRFAMKLAGAGIQIVSGMARGVDGVAGKGALDAFRERNASASSAAGPTRKQVTKETNHNSQNQSIGHLECNKAVSFAVLGCGVDICYPKENLELYERLRDEGGVLSEYPPGTLPEARLFPSRNRIISGLSDVILVIEAKEKSGTLITVDQALEQGKDVFALPGRVSDPNSTGCNRLIRQGAGIALSPETIMEYLGCGEEGRGNEAICRRLTENMPAGKLEDRTGAGTRPEQLSFDFEVLSGPEEDANITQNKLNKENDETRQEGGRKKVLTDALLREIMGLSELERAILLFLDESDPKDLDHVLPDVEKKLGRIVGFPEAMRCVTRMTAKGLVREVRVGNFVSLH